MSEHGVPCFMQKCTAVGDYCHLECPDGTTIDCRDLVPRDVFREVEDRAEKAEREHDELLDTLNGLCDLYGGSDE